MVTARERRQTDHETDQIMSNSQSDMSSQDELLMGVDRISFDSDDEDLPSARQWYWSIHAQHTAVRWQIGITQYDFTCRKNTS